MMKQISCLLSCLTHLLPEGLEERPLCIGEWNCEFTLEPGCNITWYTQFTSSQAKIVLFNALYGQRLSRLLIIEKDCDRRSVFQTLLESLNKLPADQYVFLQLDLYYLPYQLKFYRREHQPHFIIIGLTEKADNLHITDPFYDFSGELPVSVVKEAFVNNKLGECLLLNRSGLSNPAPATVGRCLTKDLIMRDDLLYDTLLKKLRAIGQQNHEGLEDMSNLFTRIGIPADLKKSYAYLAEYLAESANISADDFKREVDALLQGLNSLRFISIKASLRHNVNMFNKVIQKVEELKQLEKKIKTDMLNLYSLWKNAHEER